MQRMAQSTRSKGDIMTTRSDNGAGDEANDTPDPRGGPAGGVPDAAKDAKRDATRDVERDWTTREGDDRDRVEACRVRLRMIRTLRAFWAGRTVGEAQRGTMGGAIDAYITLRMTQHTENLLKDAEGNVKTLSEQSAENEIRALQHATLAYAAEHGLVGVPDFGIRTGNPAPVDHLSRDAVARALWVVRGRR